MNRNQFMTLRVNDLVLSPSAKTFRVASRRDLDGHMATNEEGERIFVSGTEWRYSVVEQAQGEDVGPLRNLAFPVAELWQCVTERAETTPLIEHSNVSRRQIPHLDQALYVASVFAGSSPTKAVAIFCRIDFDRSEQYAVVDVHPATRAVPDVRFANHDDASDMIGYDVVLVITSMTPRT